jgi:histidine triad (HIT) family protein
VVRRDWYCEDVLSGNTQVKVIWEDNLVLAFHHPQPISETHAVVIPKNHVSSVMDSEAADTLLLKSMFLAVQKVATLLGIDKTGAGFYVRFNAAAPGVTPHMHWHIIAPIPED